MKLYSVEERLPAIKEVNECVIEAYDLPYDLRFLVIFGPHANGYFCCIPNRQLVFEMGPPDDIVYNTGVFSETMNLQVAEALACYIQKAHRLAPGSSKEKGLFWTKYSVQKLPNIEEVNECVIEAYGLRFQVIFGPHINGYFCCIPNWQLVFEMGPPEDVVFNMGVLCHSLNINVAEALACGIYDMFC